MARTKQDPKIVRTVRGERGVLFAPGDEEKLAKVITADQIAHLTGRGSITGTWSPAPSKEAKQRREASGNGPGPRGREKVTPIKEPDEPDTGEGDEGGDEAKD
jgi:hypothetical protein